jgi:crotonobetainyl-CoA:carnitine CoA-transferase CaiB-like acyl-CoA transferase
MSVTGRPAEAPVRAGVSVIDMGSGMWLAIGVLAALATRHRTGKGTLVDTSLFETALSWMNTHALVAQVTGHDPQPQGSGVPGIVPYQAFECADGWLVLAASNDRLFDKFAQASGNAHWLADQRFTTNQARVENRAFVVASVGVAMAEYKVEHWTSLLDDAGVPNAPLNTTSQALNHPQTRALGMAQQTGIDGIHMLGLPLSFNGTRPTFRHLARPSGREEASP